MLLASILILFWSIGYIFVENGLRYSDPLAFLFLRLWLAWLIIAFILLYKRFEFPKSLKQIFIICITGLFAQGFYQVFFFEALSEKISPGILAVILGMQPLLTVIIMREVMKPMQIVGIFLGFIGLSLTVANTVIFESNNLFGISYALLSLGGMTIGTILQKKYCSNIPISLTSNLFIQYLASATIVSIICLAVGNLHVTWTASFTVSLLWIILTISIASTYLFYTLLKSGKAASVSSYFYCVPPCHCYYRLYDFSSCIIINDNYWYGFRDVWINYDSSTIFFSRGKNCRGGLKIIHLTDRFTFMYH